MGDHRHACIVCGARWDCADTRRKCGGPIRNTCSKCKVAPIMDWAYAKAREHAERQQTLTEEPHDEAR